MEVAFMKGLSPASSDGERAPQLEWSLPWRPEVEAGSERMIMDWIYDCFPLVSEHFFCWRDEANFSLLKASIYSGSHCSAGILFFSLATDAAVWVPVPEMQRQPPHCCPNLTVTTNDTKISENLCSWMTSGKSLALNHCLCVSPSVFFHVPLKFALWADLQGCSSTSR